MRLGMWPAQGDYEAARALLEESLAIFRELGDKRGIAWSLIGLAEVAQAQGDPEKARALLEEARPIGQGRTLAWRRDISFLRWVTTRRAAPATRRAWRGDERRGREPHRLGAILEVGHAAWLQEESRRVTRSHALEALALFQECAEQGGHPRGA